VPYFKGWLRSLSPKPRLLVDPFCGGGIISLTAAIEHLVPEVVMGDLDPDVSAVWRTILNGGAIELAERVRNYELDRRRVVRDLGQPAASEVDLAFKVVLKNRVHRGGILAAGASLMKDGENGKGIASRWYPETLAKRIRTIGQSRARLSFVQGDAFALINRYKHRKMSAFFIDPPYTAGGKNAGRRLYNFNELDHERLFSLLASVSGRVLMTYDSSTEVRKLARKHGFGVKEILMKNTHHAMNVELAVTK
jgi:DNA adenine methylase